MKKSISLPSEELSWTRERTALLLDITPQRLKQLVDEGRITKASNGRFNPFTVCPEYVRFLRDQRIPVNGKEREEAEQDREFRRRKNQAITLNLETETARKQGMFVLKADHAAVVKDLATQTRIVIEHSGYIKKEHRNRLLDELRDIKPISLEASKK